MPCYSLHVMPEVFWMKQNPVSTLRASGTRGSMKQLYERNHTIEAAAVEASIGSVCGCLQSFCRTCLVSAEPRLMDRMESSLKTRLCILQTHIFHCLYLCKVNHILVGNLKRFNSHIKKVKGNRKLILAIDSI